MLQPVVGGSRDACEAQSGAADAGVVPMEVLSLLCCFRTCACSPASGFGTTPVNQSAPEPAGLRSQAVDVSHAAITTGLAEPSCGCCMSRCAEGGSMRHWT